MQFSCDIYKECDKVDIGKIWGYRPNILKASFDVIHKLITWSSLFRNLFLKLNILVEPFRWSLVNNMRHITGKYCDSDWVTIDNQLNTLDLEWCKTPLTLHLNTDLSFVNIAISRKTIKATFPQLGRIKGNLNVTSRTLVGSRSHRVETGTTQTGQ